MQEENLDDFYSFETEKPLSFICGGVKRNYLTFSVVEGDSTSIVTGPEF